MKNKDVVLKFLHKQEAIGSNLYSDGKRLVSCNTVLSEWIGYTLFYNITKYSVSTSKIQNYLVSNLAESDATQTMKITDVPRNTQHLFPLQ